MKSEPRNPLQQNNSSEPGTTPESSLSSSLEEVRQRLQSFGYLDGRIGRFYLAALTRTASQFLSRCLLSFRVGLLAGSLAAILMTVGTLLFNPELLRKKLDLLLLFLYFEGFFMLLFSLLELILIFAVSAWLRFAGGRRIFLIGQMVSFLIGLAFFTYFFYWARTQIDYIRMLSNVSITTTFIILILSCIFVAKSSWLGFLVAFQESEVARALPNWRRYSIEVALSLAAVLILLPSVVQQEGGSRAEEEPVAVLGTTDRWIVLGVDGISLEQLRRLSDSGDAPYLKSLLEDSYVAPLRITEPVVPPVAWTTIATGVSPARHGILMPEVRRWRGLSSWMQVTPLELAVHSILVHAGFGQRQPVSGYLRKSKTFWEILSDHGIRTGVVNWWGSWPALPIRGWNISERYSYKLMSHGKPQDETFPSELFQRYSSTEIQLSGLEMDHFYAGIFQEQLRSDPVRVGALYLPGLDILNYDFFESRKMDPFTYTDLYRTHLHWLDQTVQEINQANEGYHLMLILYQGRLLPNERSAIVIHDEPGAVRKAETISETEIAPLLLYTCGLPVAKTMDAHLISLVVPPSRLAAMPLHFVSAYPKKVSPVESAHAGEFDDLLVEQMKSLGYLQ